jgi:hypothetical protein
LLIIFVAQIYLQGDLEKVLTNRGRDTCLLAVVSLSSFLRHAFISLIEESLCKQAGNHASRQSCRHLKPYYI